MTRLGISFLAGVGVAVTVLVTTYLSRDNDPVYQGKPLSKYLSGFRDLGLVTGGVTMNSDEPVALITPHVRLRCSDPIPYDAVRSVGTNALPMLVHMLGSKDSRLRRWIWETVEGHPFLRKRVHMKPPTTGWARQIGALGAFKELGPRATPALPGIIRLLEDPDCAPAAIIALLFIKPEREQDILSLTNAFRIQTSPAAGGGPSLIHSMAILALSTFGPRASAATPVLMDCLSSTNSRVRGTAAIALPKIGASSQSVVPLIVASLAQTSLTTAPLVVGAGALANQLTQRMEDEQALLMNLLALNEYGPQARMALPILSNFQSSSVLRISTMAKETAAKMNSGSFR